MIKTSETYLTLSSAVHGGGFGSAYRFMNWKVPLSYDCSDPVRDFGEKLNEWGYSLHTTIGMLTAAKLTHASIAETEGEAFTMLCCTTAGTSNAARSGLPHPTYALYTPGTINTFLLIDGRLTASAMVNAVITATEAKTTALQDCGIRDKQHDLPATGTTTDSIVIASSQSDRYMRTHPYAGAATTIGDAIGRLVYETVFEAVRTQGEQ